MEMGIDPAKEEEFSYQKISISRVEPPRKDIVTPFFEERGVPVTDLWVKIEEPYDVVSAKPTGTNGVDYIQKAREPQETDERLTRSEDKGFDTNVICQMEDGRLIFVTVAAKEVELEGQFKRKSEVPFYIVRR